MAKTPIVFLRNIPNDDKGQDFIATLKKLYNKDRYRILVRGQKPADKKDWVKHSYGIPIAKSKTLRLYVFDKLKDEEKVEVHDMLIKKQREVWELKDELQDLEKTVVEQRQKILALTSASANVVKTVEYHEYEIEVFCNDKYVTLDIPSKYGYKIWDCEYGRNVYENYKLHSIDGAIADAKTVIEETREELYYG